jgi:hypothetical protein
VVIDAMDEYQNISTRWTRCSSRSQMSYASSKRFDRLQDQ